MFLRAIHDVVSCEPVTHRRERDRDRETEKKRATERDRDRLTQNEIEAQRERLRKTEAEGQADRMHIHGLLPHPALCNLIPTVTPVTPATTDHLCSSDMHLQTCPSNHYGVTVYSDA